jgi:hypothetical protein
MISSGEIVLMIPSLSGDFLTNSRDRRFANLECS